MDILSQLNESQRLAVEYIDGPSLVIAGAGSGKTRVLTYKIAYLMQHGLQPWEIMALTFTNKAAREMKERIATLVGSNAAYLQMGTFHSIFSRILRREAAMINYSSNFTIYDESDSRSLCKTIIKQLELDDKIYKPADVHNRISRAKNKLQGPAAYANDAKNIIRDQEERVPEMPRIYQMYVDNCMKSNAMDFDDLLFYTFKLLHEHEEVRRKYAEQYRFILVDEYQDTNPVQQEIVWLLTKEHQKVCVVGDDAQSIYGFRGANIDNILDFQTLYTGCKLFKLEQNYRSTQRIVDAANSLIRHNERQIHKDVFSRNAEGDKLILRMLTSDKEEAINVCRDIKNCVRSGEYTWHDFAILYRTNYQSRTFEEQMLKDNMPYRIYGGMSFYQRKEIKDVLAYFRLICNPHDEEAFRRIINYPARGIGDTTVQKLMAGAQAKGESLWTVSENPEFYEVSLNKGTLKKINDFRQMIIGFGERLDTDDVFTLGQDVIKLSGISEEIYSGHNADDTSRQQNLEEFLSSMQDFVESNREEGNPVTMIDFLQDVSLMTDIESGEEQDDNKVTLMTIHSAKGLEFPCVFVVGMEENIFPSPMCTESQRELEEERRLFYVAITRAERRCVLTCAKSRFRYGRMEFDAPSRFLTDINPNLMVIDNNTADTGSVPQRRNPYQNSAYGTRKAYNGGSSYGQGGGSSYGQNSGSYSRNATGSQTRSTASSSPVFGQSGIVRITPTADSKVKQTSVTTSNGTLSVGDGVEHARFGVGKILSMEGTGDNAKAVVEFKNVGTKQLLLKFAKLKRL